MKYRHQIQLVIIIIALIFLIPVQSIPPVSHAQDIEWSATLLFRTATGGQLQIVNGSRLIDTISISDDLWPADMSRSSVIVTSTDSRFIAHQYFVEGDTSSHIRFGATGDGPCCTELSNLIGDVNEYDLGGFEPDGSRFAVSYVRANADNSDSSSAIMVVDAATSTVMAEMPVDFDLADPPFGEEWVWAKLGRWTADGIQFTVHCFACGGGYLEGHFSLWNPDTNAIIPDSGITVSEFGTALAGTGEFIYRGQDTNFFYDPTPGVSAIPNVVQYFPTGDLTQTPVPIYTQPDSTNLGGISWIGDGEAVLARASSGDYWDIIFRTGHVEHIQETSQLRFMDGTPDGWFASTTIDNRQTIVHYNIDTLQPTIVAPFPDDAISARIVHFPSLGFSVDPVPFVPITPPDVVQTAQCSGALPSRLVTGQSARVLDGAPNRIREYPGVDAPVVGEIPSGATFSIVSGPSCDGVSSIMWWYIDYDGITGWTAEGQDDTYFTEPLE